jgi:hypothetical protein
MNLNNDFNMNDLKSMQREAIQYELRQALLMAKVRYQDRIRRLDCVTRFAIRDNENMVDIVHGILPIQFLEN